jgi:hypothetical protein
VLERIDGTEKGRGEGVDARATADEDAGATGMLARLGHWYYDFRENHNNE